MPAGRDLLVQAADQRRHLLVGEVMEDGGGRDHVGAAPVLEGRLHEVPLDELVSGVGVAAARVGEVGLVQVEPDVAIGGEVLEQGRAPGAEIEHEVVRALADVAREELPRASSATRRWRRAARAW